VNTSPIRDQPPPRIAFLLSQLGAHVSQRFADRVRALDLTPSEAAVLRLVGRTPGLSQRTIAQRIGTVPSRIVKLVDGLEQRDLVSRTRSGTDRRNYELHLTGNGQATLTALRRVAEAHEAEIRDGLTDEQASHLAAALQVLARVHHLDLEVHRRTGTNGQPDTEAPTTATASR
jgi:DNA-binding MarR family transcriptional regulator